jgi:hypothetical protein
MNNALIKFLYFIESNFWDWQFFVFVVFSGLILALFLLGRKTAFNLNKFFEFSPNVAEKNEVWNCVLIVAANVLLCLLLVSISGVPVPQTHDEFGYLLAADTFLHGRISNPTPFSPQHFEYFHILLKPVYAAKYPPLQGVFLAVGTLISVYPIAGVWLSSILSSLAVYWFLRYFFSSRWALYGAFLWIAAPLNIIWCDSYWGGHVAVIGGALSLGACFRFLKTEKLKYLFIWGVGIFILLNSRLYEGTILTGILVMLWLFDVLTKKKLGKKFYSASAVWILIITANLLFIAFYNYSITRNPFVLPYSLQHSQYHRTPLFVFQNLDEPKTDVPPVMKKLDERWTADFQESYKDWFSALKTTVSRIPIYLFWMTRSPFLIALFVAGLVFALQKKLINEWRYALIILALFMVGLFLTTFTGDRFIAPVVGIFIAAATLCAKVVYGKSQFLRLLILALPVIIGAGFLCGMLSSELKRVQPPINTENFGSRREIVNYLKSQPGKHLLFLETENAFPADARFYVYNSAEIEESDIIWAHKLSFDENVALINHFNDRNVWLLKNVDNKAVLMKYDK